MNKKQSLFHIAKRDTLPWYKSFAIRGCAILLALVVCAVVTMLLTGENPVNIFATIFKGAFGSARKSWVTFQNLAVLLGISLAVTPAFKMRFWNIGAEGQVLIGCLATAACMICLADKLPNAVLILVSLAAALAAGALWGFLPAFFKAKWNTNETLFTLMMNYIATQLAAFFIIVWDLAQRIWQELEVVTPSTSFPVRRMSGGNVQKVLVGREIAQAPAVLMTAYAVRGLDINTSYTIYNLLTEQKMKGIAVMYVGEDLDVLLELCDRIVVLCGGQVSGVVDARTADKRQIGALMTRMEGGKTDE